MPPKKRRTTRAKPKMVTLTPEEQERRVQVDLFLEDFDKHVEMTIKEAWRDVETISASINTLYKLELLKLPQEVKDMKWDDFYKQSLDKGENPLALSEAISSCMDSSLCASVDTQVSNLKAAMKSTAKKRGRKKSSSENQPPSATRSSSRTRASIKNSELTTPANKRAPPNMGKTPLITPKFDTQSLSRTVARVAKKNEVLVSLSGSPVVGVSSRAAKAEAEQAILVPIGNGKTLSVPVGEDMSTEVDHLDEEQINKLEELQKSLANMLQSRNESEN